MVKTLDRYVFLEALRYFLLSMVTFLTLFAVVDFVGNVDTFMKAGMAKGLLYVLYRLPLYSVRVMPIAMLVSAMITMSSFSSTSELTVVKALGTSVHRFSAPVLLLSVLTALLSVCVQEFFLPSSIRSAREIIYTAQKKKKKQFFATPEELWFKMEPGKFVRMETFSPETGTAGRVTIIALAGDFKPKVRLDARKAVNVKGSLWKLLHCYRRQAGKPAVFSNSLTLDLGVDKKDLRFSSFDPEASSILNLYFKSKQFSKVGYDVRALLVEMYSRLALSLMPVVVTVIGVPLGIFNPRNRRGFTVLVATVLVVFMWITVSFFLSLGKSGVLPPSYSAFAPALLFSSVGLVLMGRVET